MPTKKGQRAARRPQQDDRFDLQAAGTIDMVCAGVRYTCRRPTIGEQRELAEAIEAAAAMEREVLAAAQNPEANTTRHTDDDVNHAVLDWWRLVVHLLAPEGAELPADDDDLPPWLQHRSLISEVKAHWLSVPWAPGGSPTQRAEAESLALVKQLQPLLQAAASVPQPNS